MMTRSMSTRDNADPPSECTTESTSIDDILVSSQFLQKIDDVVQKAFAMAMERKRVKIIQEIEKRENILREVLDEKIASLH